MKKLQVMIEDKLMHDLKMYALTNDTTLKDIITEAATKYIHRTIAEPTQKPKETKKPAPLVHEQKQTIIEETKGISPVLLGTDDDDQTAGGLFHLIPKTHKVGSPLKMMKMYNEGPVSWMLAEGARPHYDKNGNAIPFRFTDDTGKVCEPDLDELNELSKYYRKPVILEE